MEEKTNTNSIQVKDTYEQYENSMHDYLIIPKTIPPISKEKAYFNLNKGKPIDLKAKKRRLLFKIEPTKKGNWSDDNKGKKVAIKGEKQKYNNQSDSQNNIRIEGAPSNLKFGSHSDYSFFEYWSREIVFQLFNYHQMFFFSYKFEKPQEMEKTFDMKFLENYVRKRDNLKITKVKEKTAKDKKEINFQAKKEKTDENINIQKNIQVKKVEKKTEEYINIQSSIHVKEEKEKADEKFKIQINEKPSNEKNIKKAQKNDQGSNISMTNCISDDGMKKIDEEELMNKINSSKFEGDFDFVIPDITKEELKSVLKNKEIGPFLFYDNINEDSYEKFDIIGEVKESLEGSNKNIFQLIKYLHMFFYLKESEDMNSNLGLKMKNNKIIMYVINSEYKNYLIKLIEYKNHMKQFTSIDNKFKNEYFEAIIKNHKYGKNKNILIDILIQSKTPYIFLYLPNAVITWSLHLGEIDRLKKQMEGKDTEVNKLKKQMEEKDTEVNKLKKQMEGKDTEINKLDTKVNELNMKIISLSEAQESQTKKYQELEAKIQALLYKNQESQSTSQSTNNEG